MTRIQPKHFEKYPLGVRLFLRGQQKRLGFMLTPTLLWGRSPLLLYLFSAFFKALDRRSSPLDPGLRSMVCVRVSQINHCEFCIDLNSSILQERGVSMDKLLALEEHATNPLFSQRERATLAYTDAMSRTGTKVTDEVFTSIKEQFSEDEIVELTALIAFQNLSAKFNAALGVPPQGFCSRVPPSIEQT